MAPTWLRSSCTSASASQPDGTGTPGACAVDLYPGGRCDLEPRYARPPHTGRLETSASRVIYPRLAYGVALGEGRGPWTRLLTSRTTPSGETMRWRAWLALPG